MIGDRFQILALDGGGLRGIFSAATLTALEEDLRISTVDLVAGTSTGGSSRWAWACGHPLWNFCAELGEQVFRRPARSPLWGGLGGPTKTPQVRVAVASPTRIPRTKRHYAAHGSTTASMASLALDKPLCR